MDEHEKERIRKELRELDDLADKYGGYVVQTLPEILQKKMIK